MTEVVNRQTHRRFGLAVVALVIAVLTCRSAHAQLRIVSYNTNNGPRASSWAGSPVLGSEDVIAAIGAESVNGIARPIDVLLLQEQDGFSTTDDFLDIFDDLYGTNVYNRGTLLGATVDDNNLTIIYNTQTVQLLGETQIGATSSSGAPRAPIRYKLRPVGYDANADFYVYNSHYKASDGATNEARRLVEATAIRNNADALGEGASILYVGDFNIQSSSEGMYQHLLSSGAGQAFDPINSPGAWNNNSGFKALHTQSPTTSVRFSGQVTGGMDDRFDFQLATAEMLDGEGLSYIAGSYHALGNNGSHNWSSGNSNLDVGSNTALPFNTLRAIANASDHLPVVADYQLPAKMSVTIDPLPSEVIRGAALSVQVNVTNSAPAQTTLGADELDYDITASGDATGGASGTANALAGPNTHPVAIDTSAVGNAIGMVFVDATSADAADASFSQPVTTLVLEHANASFNALSNLDSTFVWVPVIAMGSGDVTVQVDVHNLEAIPAMTADLLLTGATGSGATGTIGLQVDPVAVAPGSAETLDVIISSDALGQFFATYHIHSEDEALPGATSGADLALNVLAAVAMPGDLNLDNKVDGFDLFTLAGNLNAPAVGWADGDFDGSGFVDQADVQALAANWLFGTTAPSSPEFDALLAELTAPEPVSGALLLLSLTCLLPRRRGA